MLVRWQRCIIRGGLLGVLKGLWRAVLSILFLVVLFQVSGLKIVGNNICLFFGTLIHAFIRSFFNLFNVMMLVTLDVM